MKFTLDRKLTPIEVAEAFCELDDEGQAQVFIEAARIAESWPTTNGGATYQWYLVGKHLQTCECSTYEARDMVNDIAEGMKLNVGADSKAGA